jgi:hypothetical protein
MVSAAPDSSGGGDWFHQHFSVGKDLFRVRAIFGGRGGESGEARPSIGTEIGAGGRALGYPEEDPMIRKMYQEALEKEGAKFDMPEEVYDN